MFCKWKWIWKIEVKMCSRPPMPHLRLTPAFLWQIMIKIPHLHSYSPVTGVQEGKLSLKKTFSFLWLLFKNIEVILSWPESEIFKHEWNLKSSDKNIFPQPLQERSRRRLFVKTKRSSWGSRALVLEVF